MKTTKNTPSIAFIDKISSIARWRETVSDVILDGVDSKQDFMVANRVLAAGGFPTRPVPRHMESA